MLKLLLASNNHGKIEEIKALLNELELLLVTPAQVGLSLKVEETGGSYAENAELKATAFSEATGLLTMADDSGLEVDALNGAPGLYSARYSLEPDATDGDRRQYLLGNLVGIDRPWLARFRCVIALSTPGEQIFFSEGECPGEIIPEERGTNGFGYDPIFLIPDFGRTMAELSMQEKNKISHRANAVRTAQSTLCKIIEKLS